MPYHHFTREDRYVISHMALAGFSLREIGRRIGRHHTSISREITRNRPTYDDDAVYWYYDIESIPAARKRRARHQRRQHERLIAYVHGKLKRNWSPETICGRLKVDYPDDASMRLCHETIYRWIYRDSKNKGTLHHHLRRRHNYSRRQKRCGSGRLYFRSPLYQ
jgi:transposase, IS30 family